MLRQPLKASHQKDQEGTCTIRTKLDALKKDVQYTEKLLSSTEREFGDLEEEEKHQRNMLRKAEEQRNEELALNRKADVEYVEEELNKIEQELGFMEEELACKKELLQIYEKRRNVGTGKYRMLS